MDEEVYFWDDSLEEPSEDDVETSVEDAEDSEETASGNIEERIDDLIEQIGDERSYGSIGDYFVPGIGCYAFPGEDVFYHFISEEERSGWTAASNGCYVPNWSIEAYESYLSSGNPDEETEGQGEEQLPPSVSQNDLAGIQETLEAIYQQDAIYHTAVITNNQQTDQRLKEINAQLTVISIVLIVLCVFLAIFCGKGFADTFFERMRAG